jgi:hypothetical protein
VPTELIVREIAADDRAIVVNGREVLRGNSLARLVSEVGGYEGEIAHPTTGELFEISLLPWIDRHPETTWLALGFASETPPTWWGDPSGV